MKHKTLIKQLEIDLLFFRYSKNSKNILKNYEHILIAQKQQKVLKKFANNKNSKFGRQAKNKNKIKFSHKLL